MQEELKQGGKIIEVNLEEQMKSAYIDYAMSVIVSRALPDVRDGFKPVHRRILYGMNELGNTPDKAYKKCARTVGDVMGKYHPHGDSSIYMALVRLAQEWSMRYTLVDPHGNFGSVDGDGPAAMRYTESRLAPLAMEMLADINKETVDMVPNYDDSTTEPSVLPTRIPNLLVNGASGIAVGMATNMAPHNLTEVMQGALAYIEKRGDITIDELMEYIKAPDFPTGGTIYGYQGVKDAFHTGRGRIVIRGKAEIEVVGQHEQIIITEIPYNVIKKDLVKSIADLATSKKIEGIANVQDESSGKIGMRIVVDVKRDANAGVVLNKLYKYTTLQSSFSVNNIALVDGRPKLLNLKDLIGEFVKHRHEVVTRRTIFDLRKAEERLHILEGRIIAADNIDEVVAIIKASQRQTEAIEKLMARFSLSQIQARSIVEMRLGQLTGMELDKLRAEYDEVTQKVAYYKEILADENILYGVISDEIQEIIDKYGDARKCDIVYATADMNPEDFYSDDDMVITISHFGYIKRTPLVDFRAQSRGGVGAKGSDTREEDFVEYIYSASMHATLMFFTDQGRCYWLRVFEIPEGAKNAKGRAIQNLLNLEPNSSITAVLRVKNLTTDEDFVNSHYLTFFTKEGLVRKSRLKDFSRPRQSGIIAIKLRDEDKVVSVMLSNGKCDFVIGSKHGRAVRFSESVLRPLGRSSMGVRGMRLADSLDEVVGAVSIKHPEEETILVISENGYGKRSYLEDYPLRNRGGKGVITLKVTEKTGELVSIHSVTDEHDIMIINKSGVTIRTSMKNIAIIGRNTQGVKLINLSKRGDEIASTCRVLSEEEPEEEDLSEGVFVEDGIEEVDGVDVDVNEEDDEDKD
ncbi:DNA gyrase subunit A [Porphyromonas levii]|uniref:DNA gyrase subunit A n=1 Tax=Porphyromonas levii TaxID=28114 RepID=UPI001B8CD7E6|nr:DNA gyrase subunit A [Porphyromonas levii]MBR8703813.1 DNA gyrase subunit A [Porphyromonas levii]MBR8732070.1 DNA gyrase subunit A [Porphyromonas levii]MBR8764495.1 DNA gyrase subunit A [Porphyromonas levii]